MTLEEEQEIVSTIQSIIKVCQMRKCYLSGLSISKSRIYITFDRIGGKK